ncbi:hypothetical protein OAG63_00435 [Methylacidiphilales bacterium]|nr:hypothetical protein [Candidatus Methylacidiphilales bacterium]
MRYIEAFIVILACIGSLYLGANIVTLDPAELGIVAALILVGIWALTAGSNWWTPILTGATILGVFKFGVKIYPLEVSIGLALVALAPLLAIGNDYVLQFQRKPFPFIFYATAVYISIRFMIDIIPAHGARGNLGRVYFEAIWPFVFGWLFHRYGKLSAAPVAITVAFCFLVLRTVGALIGFVTNTVLYIPGINYVLSFSEDASLLPLRAIALSLFLISLILFHSSRMFINKVLLLPFMVASIVLLIMGASRFAVPLMLLLPLAFCVWTRRWITLLFSTSAAVALVVFVNFFPHSIEQLPPVAERSLSGLIIHEHVVAVQELTEGSDLWHNTLRQEGYNRWMNSPATIVFGTGVHPSPEIYETNQFKIPFETLISIAANLASYECGFWAVLATLGIAGFGLYAFLFIYFWREALPYILRRPTGTLKEGLVFWGFYTSVVWYLASYYIGSFPSLELFMMIMAVDVAQDENAKRNLSKTEPIPPYR